MSSVSAALSNRPGAELMLRAQLSTDTAKHHINYLISKAETVKFLQRKSKKKKRVVSQKTFSSELRFFMSCSLIEHILKCQLRGLFISKNFKLCSCKVRNLIHVDCTRKLCHKVLLYHFSFWNTIVSSRPSCIDIIHTNTCIHIQSTGDM